MGEVRVRVTLTNAADVVMARHGFIHPNHVRSVETEGIVDTGAVISTIPEEVFDALGLDSQGELDAWLADNSSVRVRQSEAVNIEIEGRRTSEDMLVMGDTVLLGQTVLERLDFLVDCRGQRLIPNPAHGNQRVMAVR